MADFLKAFALTLYNEGGYSNDLHDPGGETIYGITHRDHPDLWANGTPTLDQAYKRYFDKYWTPLGLEYIKNQKVAEELFDTGVNMGVRRAVRIAQEALNLLDGSLTVDGLMGPATKSALNDYSDIEALLKVLNGRQFAHYVDIITNSPELKRYFRGWMRRIS